MSSADRPLLELSGVTRTFRVRLPGRRAAFLALDDVALSIKTNETLAVVGESGCGKTTLARVLLRLLAPTTGQITFKGSDITTRRGRQLGAFRQDVQAVFQDPYGSLDPRHTAQRIVMEPLRARGEPKRTAAELASTTLESVGISRTMAARYPHEFSGGQRQRIGIARAIIGKPNLVVLDEPTSALDVTVQAQVIQLLGDLQTNRELTYVFISHDLALVRHFATRVVVMYLGTIVEEAPVADLFTAPVHPYTVALLSAIPIPNPLQQKARPRIVLEGELSPSAVQRRGCRFAGRCWLADSLCESERPKLLEHAPGHWAACHKPGQATALGRDAISGWR